VREKVSSTSASFSKVVTAFGYFGPCSVPNRVIASRASALVLRVHHFVERGFHAGLEPLRELVERMAIDLAAEVTRTDRREHDHARRSGRDLGR
jgi:putative transposon-encoded protein